MDTQSINPVKEYRLRIGKTVRALASDWGTSFATLSRIENGSQLISEELLPTISQAIGVPAKELRPDLVEKHEAIFGEAV